MEEKVKQTRAQKFRESATDEHWKEMVADHEKLSDVDFKTKHGFTCLTLKTDCPCT